VSQCRADDRQETRTVAFWLWLTLMLWDDRPYCACSAASRRNQNLLPRNPAANDRHNFSFVVFPAWGIAARRLVGACPGTPIKLVAMAHRPNAPLRFDAVRAAIAAELRRLHSDLLQEPIPKPMAELLRQLDQTTQRHEDSKDI
jgi:hypothetical protein